MACGFDALADLEELQIEKSPYTPDARHRSLLNPEPDTSLSLRVYLYGLGRIDIHSYLFS